MTGLNFRQTVFSIHAEIPRGDAPVSHQKTRAKCGFSENLTPEDVNVIFFAPDVPDVVAQVLQNAVLSEKVPFARVFLGAFLHFHGH